MLTTVVKGYFLPTLRARYFNFSHVTWHRSRSSGIASANVENAVDRGTAFAEVAEPQGPFVFVALESVADIAEPRVSVDIDFLYDVLVPASVFAVGLDSSGRPNFFASPNIG